MHRRRRHAAPRARILLAEDDHDLRCVLERYFELQGFEVRSVPSGTRLLEELANQLVRGGSTRTYDLIVTDIRMPGRDGLSILTGLRRDGWSRPVVVISACSDDDTRQRIERLGATFMAKPLDLDVLARTLSTLHHSPRPILRRSARRPAAATA